MPKIKLKPCPFCGGKALIAKDNHDKILIECETCHLFFGIDVENGTELFEGWKAMLGSVEEAVSTWNRRTPDGGDKNV